MRVISRRMLGLSIALVGLAAGISRVAPSLSHAHLVALNQVAPQPASVPMVIETSLAQFQAQFPQRCSLWNPAVSCWEPHRVR